MRDWNDYSIWRENLDQTLYVYFGTDYFYDQDVGEWYGINLEKAFDDGMSPEDVIRMIAENEGFDFDESELEDEF
jgi:hypothetical protein